MLLFATRFDPAQTPFPSVPTQFPFRVYLPAPQMMQSLEFGPEHVWQSGEHGLHVVPSLKLLSGQTVPLEVVAWLAIQWVRSFASCVKPDLHEMHSPLPSAHFVQPSLQTAWRR